MIFLPIVDRELRGRARQSSTFVLRAGLTLLALLLCWFMAQISRGPGAAPNGKNLFQALALLGELVALCGGLFTADCISRERREGTLGLLFLTDLKGYDVLLGKAASIGLGLALALLGLIPCLSLPLLMGGVRGAEVLQAVAAIAMALFYSVSLGMWISTQVDSSHQAFRQAAAYLLAWSLLPLLVLCLEGFHLAPWFAAFSPAFPYLWMHMGPGSPAAAFPPYLFSFPLLLVFSAGYLWAADRRLRAHWQTPETAPARPADTRASATRKPFATRSDRQPIAWLIARQPHFRTPFFWAAGLLALRWLLPLLLGVVNGVGGLNGVWFNFSFQFSIGFAANGLAAWAASRYLVEARLSGELELLLHTPVGAQSFIQGYWRAIWRGVRWPLLVVVAGSMIQFGWIAFQAAPRMAGEMQWYYLGLMILVPISGTVQLLALCWVAIRLGARARRVGAAVVGTLALVMISGWVMSMLFNWVVQATVNMFGSGQIYLILAFGFLPIVAKDVILWQWAKRSLLRPGFLAGK